MAQESTATTNSETRCARQSLSLHRKQWQASLEQLFSEQPNRASKFSASLGDIYLDYSKSHLTEETLTLLTELAEQCQLPKAIEDLFEGQQVNNTELRPALHTLLRDSNASQSSDILQQYHQQVSECQQQMQALVEKVHQGQWLGYTGQAVTDIINIGIGGSDLGPRMVCQALEDFHQENINVRFVANIDPAELLIQLNQLNPETTLFIVASKSFTTQETLVNALTARKWLMRKGCPMGKLQQHFIAASSNIDKAVAFGIAEENIFPLWDWVGGRYSLWSAIGLPIALAVGWSNFKDLLAGAETMDHHYRNAAPRDNLPVLLALITFWYSEFWQASSQAILPYSHNLRSFPMFLQQMDMESLGKCVDRQGTPLSQNSGLIIWGTEESNGQHSFHQLLLQGTRKTPVDFIAFSQPNNDFSEQHTKLLAACLSQSQALLNGKSRQQATEELLSSGYDPATAEQIAPHKVIAGDSPSNTLLVKQLTPHNLGALIALYEHKVYTLSVLMNINAFDQWGVELGKQLGQFTYEALKSGITPEEWDSSTTELVKRIRDSSQ
ncbi:MAG: glucose-6-phosphate isomerase [Candidatus Pelagadaptatus aseana]|uniref:glucose-6-phosphate isomerase n=1 Tax=Candidatus Pelagadaptatus aseana TaxID=3120508 RepID=UPI0039B305EA